MEKIVINLSKADIAPSGRQGVAQLMNAERKYITSVLSDYNPSKVRELYALTLKRYAAICQYLTEKKPTSLNYAKALRISIVLSARASCIKSHVLTKIIPSDEPI